MRSSGWTLVGLVTFALIVRPAGAERRPERNDEATHVLTGIIRGIAAKESSFCQTGVMTHYTAELVIDGVEKGTGLTAGKKIELAWSNVTKWSTPPCPGAYGHHYKVGPGDRVRAYLKGGGHSYFPIYSREAMARIDP